MGLFYPKNMPQNVYVPSLVGKESSPQNFMFMRETLIIQSGCACVNLWNAKCDKILVQCILILIILVNICVNGHTNILLMV